MALKLYRHAKIFKVINTFRARKPLVFPNSVNRRSSSTASNQIYVGDMTYLPISDGRNMYLATVIICYSRWLAGFARVDHRRVSLAQDSLLTAQGQRGSQDSAIFHSNHGSFCTTQAFHDICRQLAVRQSMGQIGTSADNPLSESFNTALKREVLRNSKTLTHQLACR